jgi:hypothetical protein
MSARARSLAAAFEALNDDAIATVERLGDAEWGKVTREGWTVAACAHHTAITHEGIAGFAREIASGSARRRSGPDTIHESNARHAEEYATCSKVEVLEALRARGAAAAAVVRALDDEQLDRTTDAIPGMTGVSTARLIEMALIGHLREHLDSIKLAAGQRDQS